MTRVIAILCAIETQTLALVCEELPRCLGSYDSSASEYRIYPRFHTRRSGPKGYPNPLDALARDARLKDVVKIGEI